MCISFSAKSGAFTDFLITPSNYIKQRLFGASLKQMRLSERYLIGHSPQRLRSARPHTPSVNALLVPDNFPPTEIFSSETGIQGEVLRVEPCGTQKLTFSEHTPGLHTHIVLLPGNPGVIEYYRPLVQMLWQRLPHNLRSHCHIHALGLPGHDLRELNGQRQFGISDHISYCLSYLRSSILEPSMTTSSIIFMGHSYGSYLALRITEQLTDAEFADSSLLMLMPALWKMGYCAGFVIRLILSDKFGLFSLLFWFISAILPPLISEAVIRALSQDKQIRRVSRALIDGSRRYLYANIGSLGRDEMLNIVDPRKMPLLKLFAGRTLLVYVDGDRWCPPLGKHAIVDAFDGFLDTTTPGSTVEHAFVMSLAQNARVVDVILPWLIQKMDPMAR